jgi:hypothetical protein
VHGPRRTEPARCRESFRHVLRDPELLRDPEFADIVDGAVDRQFNAILRQAREERMTQAIAQQAEARAKSRPQATRGPAHPFADDIEHTPEFMDAVQAGQSVPQARQRAREAHPGMGRRPGWRPGAAAAASRADEFAYRTSTPDEMWPTRDGVLRIGRSDHQLPGQIPEPPMPAPPEDIAAKLPPGHDSAILNRGI